MNEWADKVIAHSQGYARAVLFPRARDALNRYLLITGHDLSLPICVCPEIAYMAAEFEDVDGCGLASGTQLYGYRREHANDLDLDPLMTGWWVGAINPHRIVSFGANKILPLVGGGAFLTNDSDLADQMEEFSFFPGGDNYARKVTMVIGSLEEVVYKKHSLIKMWDRYLGDMLGRVAREQVMPWNVMRTVSPGIRPGLIKALRAGAIAVSTNYPVYNYLATNHYPGGYGWESSVISFPLHEDNDRDYERYVYRAAQIIYGVLNT